MGLFETDHIIWLSLTLALIAVVLVLFAVCRAKINAVLTVGLIVMIATELVKMASNVTFEEDWETAPQPIGFFVSKTTLPFHLCSLQMIFLLIARLAAPEGKARRILLPFISTCGILGALMGILIPIEGTSFGEPGMDVLQAIKPYRYFISHAFLIAVGLRIAFDKGTHWGIRSYGSTVAMLFLLFVASLYINAMFHTNFLFTSYPPMGDLPILNLEHGNTISWYWYLVKLVLCGIVLISVFYLPILVVWLVKKRLETRVKAIPVREISVEAPTPAPAFETEETPFESYAAPEQEAPEQEVSEQEDAADEDGYTDAERAFIEEGTPLPEDKPE